MKVMMNQILYTIGFVSAFFGIIKFCEVLYKTFGVNPEITRKIAHILASISTLSFIFLFNSHWYVLLLAIIFFNVLLWGKKLKLFDSIENVNRQTAGSYLLPVSIYLLFFIAEKQQQNLYFILPLLILGISDPLAGSFSIINSKKLSFVKFGGFYLQKTYVGSLIFFISTFLIIFSIFAYSNIAITNPFFYSIIFAFIITITELFSSKGLDNLTIPLVSLVLLHFVLG